MKNSLRLLTDTVQREPTSKNVKFALSSHTDFDLDMAKVLIQANILKINNVKASALSSAYEHYYRSGDLELLLARIFTLMEPFHNLTSNLKIWRVKKIAFFD
jgi:hypothetical protein